MSVYEALALTPVINASATLTRLGGSRMPPSVIEAMSTAAGSFTDLDEMQRKAGERIAAITYNEAAYISSGAAAGITVSVAACIAGTDQERVASFPFLDEFDRNEVIVYRSQRNGYDYAARQTGARLVDVGPSEADLSRAISERTACILWFAGTHYAEGALPLDEVVDIARARGVPVIVDAAAQVPPVSSLWRFTRDLGADIAIFSGGKGLRGPQSSGLVLGKRDLIEACRVNGNPNHSIGRPMKVGKEELAGILAAVEWSLAQDETTILSGYEETVQFWIDGLANIPGVVAERGYPSEAGQPHGRAIVCLAPHCRLTRDEIVTALWEGSPRIAVGILKDDENAIALNPQTLEPGEAEIVLATLRKVLHG
jgi:L-seryl-tRNA(Ser) seleniumtransferase